MAEHDDAALVRELEGLKKDYEALRMEQVRVEQDLANLTRQLGELEQRAQAEYGTADPQALAELLEAKRAENARLVAEYRGHVAGVRAALQAVERDFAQAGADVPQNPTGLPRR